jgi:FMN phosphatase YigB (HAD superfamily)
MRDVWRVGSIGMITLDDVHEVLKDSLGQYMADLWREYLGTANTELIEYARGLSPRYRTEIVSNSFVGAWEREQAAYGFEDLVEEIVYSHEAGFSKLDPRVYAIICTRLNVPPGEMVILDDTKACVVGARDVASTPSATRTMRRPKLLVSP